jgi:hypothetical protein
MVEFEVSSSQILVDCEVKLCACIRSCPTSSLVLESICFAHPTLRYGYCCGIRLEKDEEDVDIIGQVSRSPG